MFTFIYNDNTGSRQRKARSVCWMKRQFQRKIHGDSERGYWIKWPVLEGTELYRAKFKDVRDRSVLSIQCVPDVRPDSISEHRAVQLTRTDCGLDVTVEIGPAEYTSVIGTEKELEYWASFGKMIYFGLPNLVDQVSYGLSKSVIQSEHRLDTAFQPAGRWRFDGPGRGYKPGDEREHGTMEDYWYRASVSLHQDELRPLSFEDLLLTYVNDRRFVTDTVKGSDVTLNYQSKS